MSNEINLGSLYEINQNLMENEKPLDAIQVNKLTATVANWMGLRDKYFMLLCREKNDFTLFNIKAVDDKALSQELRETLQNRGVILSIDPTEDGVAYEIWIKHEGVNSVYYLFPYTEGVIEIGKCNCCKSGAAK